MGRHLNKGGGRGASVLLLLAPTIQSMRNRGLKGGFKRLDSSLKTMHYERSTPSFSLSTSFTRLRSCFMISNLSFNPSIVLLSKGLFLYKKSGYDSVMLP